MGVLAGSGCAAAPEPAPATESAPASPTASATATDAPTSGPALIPDGSADDNLPYFSAVIKGVWGTDQSVQGRSYIDALVAAGFPKAEMELTQDRTTVDNPADAIQFSVRWRGECLVGQVGPSTPEPTAVVLPQVPGGTCLIGQTRPIDW